MKGAYGRCWYGVQGAGKGTPATAFAPFGIIDRPHLNVPSGIEPLYSVGDWDPVELSEGMTLAEVGLSIPAVEDPHFLQYAKRSAVTGELSWMTIKIGYHKGADVYQAIVQDCKINDITIRCDAGGRLNADCNLIGGKVAAAAVDPGDMSFLSARAYRWFEMTWDETRDLRAFEFYCRNGLEPMPVIAGTVTTRDPERIWDFLDEGASEIGGSLTYFLADASEDLQACLLVGADHIMSFESCAEVSPVQVMTLTLNGLKARNADLQIPARGDIIVEVPYLLTDWTLAG